jgi:HK97 family phage portal protein
MAADELAVDPPAPEVRATYSIGDPALAEWFGLSGQTTAGVVVNESTSMGLTAVYRAVSIIAGTIAGLPLKTYRDLPDGTRERVASFLDNPDGPDGMTPFEWVELVLVHLLLHGNAYLLHVYNGAGGLAGLMPIHPMAVAVHPVRTDEEHRLYDPFRRYFKVTDFAGQTQIFTPLDLTHVPALGSDGLKGLSPIEANRQAIGTGLAGEKAAARMFASGLLIGGMVSGDEDMNQADAQAALDGIKAKVAGADHAGDVAFINAKLKFTPWTMPAVDAQFIESRIHQVEEVSRIFGIPPHLLGQTEKQTSWGTGVAEQNRGLARYTLMSWTTRLEQRLSRLLATPRFVEFDYAGLLQPAPEQEIPLLLSQVQGGLLSLDEARAVRNLGPAQEKTGGNLTEQVNAATALIRAGFDPVSALAAVGLPPVEHLGLLPVTLQKAEQFDAEADLAAAEADAGDEPAPVEV